MKLNFSYCIGIIFLAILGTKSILNNKQYLEIYPYYLYYNTQYYMSNTE